MRKNIKLVSLFVYTGDDDNIRINTVYDLLAENNDLELITTDFNHRKKEKHQINKSKRNLKLINVPEYKQNLSIKRFYSHGIFAYRLYKYLNKINKKPDVIYCIVPTISSAYACGLICKKFKIKLAVDVIDLWPESLIAILPFKKFFEIITLPWKLFANKIYAKADYLFAESVEYAKVAQKHNKKTKALAVYLGTDIEKYEKLITQSTIKIEKPENEIWMCYGGGMGNSYDFDVILEAIKEIHLMNKYKFKFLFIGGGLKLAKIQEYIDKYNLPAIITGFLPYHDFLKYLSFCDIALNSFNKNTKVVHSYKFNDYLLSGLAIVNNLKGETAELIENYKSGINFDYKNNLLKDKLVYLLENKSEIAEMKKNSLYIANNVFNTKIIYKEMLKQIES